MNNPKEPRCAFCDVADCATGKDCFDLAGRGRDLYADARIAGLHRASSAIEARHYCQAPRIQEVRLFATEMGYRKLGLAFCVGLATEAEIVARILQQEFQVVSVCCKIGGLAKKEFNLEQILPDRDPEVMCNPAGQASVLNDAGTELNILCGLCVGHDAIFTMTSRAPVTTLIVKDRVLAHNPVGAIYSRYLRRTMLPEDP
jgi:uncharacterized metal-binding protein